jgi:hypothetical protein
MRHDISSRSSYATPRCSNDLREMRGICALPLLLLACALTRGSGVTLPEARADALSAARATSLRGWNSYNGWGGAVNETVLLAVADFMQARATAKTTGAFESRQQSLRAGHAPPPFGSDDSAPCAAATRAGSHDAARIHAPGAR